MKIVVEDSDLDPIVSLVQRMANNKQLVLDDIQIAALRNLELASLNHATHRHFKGGLYRFLLIAADESDPEKRVAVYRDTATEKVWVRPLHEFQGKVEQFRFALLEAPENLPQNMEEYEAAAR